MKTIEEKTKKQLNLHVVRPTLIDYQKYLTDELGLDIHPNCFCR